MMSSVLDGGRAGARRWILYGSCRVVGLTVLAMLTSCGASVFVIDNGRYDALWQKDWAVAIKDSAPWNPAQGNPGVCNKGGSLQGCYGTDEAVIPDLQQMLKDLDGPVVPAQYQAGNSTIRTGLQDDVAALRMRDDAIKTNNDAEFTSARSKALAAARELEAGYAQFPAAAPPPTVPFGGGLSG